MPIGKNAIKRVENNGYSNVETSAPDMENSVVAVPAELSEPEPIPAEIHTPAKPKRKRRTKAEIEAEKAAESAPVPVETQAPVKPGRGRRSKAVKEEKTQNNVKVTKKTVKEPKEISLAEGRKNARKTRVSVAKAQKNGFERVELGEEMPYWLL